MRKFEIMLGGLALIVLSGSVTYYLVNHPIRSEQGPMPLGTGTKGAISLSPTDIIKKPQATPLGAEDANSSRQRAQREVIIDPLWKPGNSRVEEAKPVTENLDFVKPVWSPVGMDIAVTKSNLSGIYITGAAIKDPRTLTEDANAGIFYKWNIDGMSLLFQESEGRYANLLITGEKYPAPVPPRRIFEQDGVIYFQPEDGDPFRVSGSQDRFFNPVLSPDEKKVAYQGRETGIYFANIDASNATSVGRGSNPSWLPDSTGIVYDVPVDDGASAIDGDLWFASIDGSERTNLTNTPGIAESFPSVSPTGGSLAFSSDGGIYVGKFVRGKSK